MKKPKNIPAHTSNTGKAMGDHYGTGVRNPIGKIRDMSQGFNPVPKSKLKKPPRSLA